MYRYMIRVSGLGSVEALFLPDVSDDEMARQRVASCRRTDTGISVVALFRVEEVRLDCATEERPSDVFLQTGIPDKRAGDVKNKFFQCSNIAKAREKALKGGWCELKLYRCCQIGF